MGRNGRAAAALAATAALLTALLTTGLALPARAAAPDGGPRSAVVLALAQRPGDAARLHALGQAGLARSPEAVAARRTALAALAPERRHRDAVTRFAAAHGLDVLRADDWSVTLSGDAAALAGLFGTRLAGGTAVRPTADPVVPPALLGDVTSVAGLDERPLFRPRAVPGLTSATLRAQYAMTLPGSTGSGVTVGTLNLTGWNPSDLTTYASTAGLPLAAGQITTVPVDNPANPLVADGSGWDFEVAMDAETILAAAPAAKQRMYFAPNNGYGTIDVFNQMALDGAAGLLQVASTSWGLCEKSSPTSYQSQVGQAVDRMLAAGVTLYAAAGDSGAYDCSTSSAPDNTLAVDFPASYPNVVGVGGTRIGLTETAWGTLASSPGTSYAGSGGGGGTSAVWSRPAWQGALSPAGSMRLVPDVASVADPGTGLGVYNGGWYLGGGTSLGAPTWAGLTAAALSAAGRTTGLGNVLPSLYAHPEAFRDVVAGSNGFAAGAGYDRASGLGVPVWSTLGPLLTGAPATAPAPTPDTTAPTTTARAGLLTGLTSQVRFSWAGQDPLPSSGVDHYTVSVTEYGGSTLLSTTTTATGTTMSLVPGRTYTLTARTTDVAGNTGPAAVARISVPYDQAALALSGSWARDAGSGDYRGSHYRSAARGASAKAVVAGRTVTIGVVGHYTGGYLDVYLDGRRTSRLDLYSATTQWRRQVRIASWSTHSRHTVQLVVVGAHRSGSRGSNVFLDSLTVTP